MLACPLGYSGSQPPHLHRQQEQGVPPEPGSSVEWGHIRPAHAKRQLGLWTNGTIWTGADETDVAEALLVDETEGSVLAVGSLGDVMRHAKALEQQATPGGIWSLMHDLQGRFLMPGFVDPHVHFLQAGLFLSSAQLRGAASKQQFQAAVAAHVARLQALEQQQLQQHQQRGGREGDSDGMQRQAQQQDAPLDGQEPEAALASAAAAGTPPAPPPQQRVPPLWVQGGGWDEGLWQGHALPDASWLDEVTGAERPALLSRMDSHMAVANTAALRLAGLLPAPDAPPPDLQSAQGGVVDVDGRGRPTGVLRENAIGLVARLIPSPSREQLAAALQAATDYALAQGITTVNCLGRSPFTGDLSTTWEDLEEVFDPAADRGELRLRIMAFTPLRSWERLAARAGARGHLHLGGRLLTGGVKEFADGSLGSRTALVWRPYIDNALPPDAADPAQADTNTAGPKAAAVAAAAAGDVVGAAREAGSMAAAAAEGGRLVENGTRMVSLADLYRLVRGADAANLSVAVHAIGDRAVDEVLGVFERVRRTNRALHAATAGGTEAGVPAGGPLHRLEHMQHVLSAVQAGARAAALNVAATPNPLHLLTDGELMLRRLGPQRAGAGRSYAFRSLGQQGMTLGLASDWPVVDLNPLGSVFAAAFRRDWSAAGDALPPVWASSDAEMLPLAQALLGHTRDAAHVALMGHLVGSLRPGMRADFVVLSASVLSMQPGQPLPEVLHTMVDGRCAYGCNSTTSTAELAA